MVKIEFPFTCLRCSAPVVLPDGPSGTVFRCSNCNLEMEKGSVRREQLGRTISLIDLNPHPTGVFKQAVSWILSEDRITASADGLIKLIFQTDHLEDDRAIALVCAAVVEMQVDMFLSHFFPRASDLTKDSSYTFSLKLKVARGLDFCPNRFFDDADAIRGARNEFAHRIECARFDDVSLKRQAEVRNRLLLQTSTDLTVEQVERMSHKQRFITLTQMTVAGIGVYAQHAKEFVGFIRTDKFLVLLERHLRPD